MIIDTFEKTLKSFTSKKSYQQKELPAKSVTGSKKSYQQKELPAKSGTSQKCCQQKA